MNVLENTSGLNCTKNYVITEKQYLQVNNKSNELLLKVAVNNTDDNLSQKD